MRKSGGRKSKQLIKAIQEKLNIPNPSVWYEPINGPCIEMQGYAGGWYWAEEDGADFGDPIGYNIKDALEMIDLISKTREL